MLGKEHGLINYEWQHFAKEAVYETHWQVAAFPNFRSESPRQRPLNSSVLSALSTPVQFSSQGILATLSEQE